MAWSEVSEGCLGLGLIESSYSWQFLLVPHGGHRRSFVLRECHLHRSVPSSGSVVRRALLVLVPVSC
jgi:hypothetical protein